MPNVWLGDPAGHFETWELQLVAETLGTTHRFAVANSPRTMETVESMIREKVQALKVVPNEGRWLLVERVQVVPAGQ